MAPGTPIEVTERNRAVVITPVKSPRRSLSDILRSSKKKFPNGNPHGEIDFGPAIGKE